MGAANGSSFKKGQCGNPHGRPKKDADFIEACRKASPRALKFLESVLDNEEADLSDRIKAATWIAERGYGKAAQAVEVAGDIEIKINLNK